MNTPTYHLSGVVKARSEDMEDFDGPLDVILQLLQKNKIEIQDLQISLILDQYLEYLEQMAKMDLEVASEFVAMASHLLYLKTRMLLSVNDEEALSEMELLKRSLEERQRKDCYAKIKTATPFFASRGELGRDLCVKPPEPLSPSKTYNYSHKPQDLIKAMASILDRGEKLAPPSIQAFSRIVGREPYPVDAKAGEIIKKLISGGISRFKALFRGSKSRSELVATFIAVLELCKSRRIRIAGGDEDCTLTYLGKSEEEMKIDTEVEADGAS